MLNPRMISKLSFGAAGLCVALLLAQPAAADWLVTVEGKLIETKGPWVVDGDTVAYMDSEDEVRILPLAEVNMRGSAEKTALEQGKSSVSGEAGPGEAPQTAAAAVPEKEPKITVYMTSWCGYCRKTQKLLKSLDADFVAKDIEKDREAALEFRKKSGGRGGVPLIDLDGHLVRGYNEQSIRRLVSKIQKSDAG